MKKPPMRTEPHRGLFRGDILTLPEKYRNVKPNSYAHHASYEQSVATVLGTDTHGDIRILSDGAEPTITTFPR